jgi:hypothetical protein
MRQAARLLQGTEASKYQRNEARRGAVRSAAGLRAEEARAPKPTERIQMNDATIRRGLGRIGVVRDGARTRGRLVRLPAFRLGSPKHGCLRCCCDCRPS